MPGNILRSEPASAPRLSHLPDELTALRAMVEGTVASIGEQFFAALVQHMARAMGVKYGFVAEFLGEHRARTLAYWRNDELFRNVEWDLRGTPCEDVVYGSLCHHPFGVKQKFPQDTAFVNMGIESYLGVPLRDMEGNTLGHLAIFSDQPMPGEPRLLYMLNIFAARATAELLRLRAESRLRESEERYRDLYEEAPHAYVALATNGSLVNVNQRATQLLGRTRDELLASSFLDHVSATGKARELAQDSLRGLQEGLEVSGVELEMRRSDDRPLWISLWIKPMRGLDGQVQSGRSIWVDITQRVLAEAERSRLQQQNLYLQEEIKSLHNFEEIVGRCDAIVHVFENVRQVAPTDTSVLIHGETGTGKELIARAIHSNSTRSGKPLIKVNCAALPTGLVESELFGHERGAFSGAIARRIGRFELAHGGTIFLDEIGEMPLDVQAKLLRVLQEREFERVGGSSSIRCDVRVIAATNRDLTKAAREGAFRQDLYYRLSVFPIRLPPLRERAEDVPLLVQFLIAKFRTRIGKEIEGVTPATMERFLSYAWPGNVRELENVIERAVIVARTRVLDIEPAVPGPSEPAEQASVARGTLEDIERHHIQTVLDQTGWVIDGPHGAARILGLHPNTLRSRLKRLRIERARQPGK